jgi:hypothetical protein
MGRRAPSESTIPRIVSTVDLDALDAALPSWLTARLPATPPPARPGSARPIARTIARMIAIDGKTARGARRADGPAVHLLAALDHTHGVVLGQTEVDGKSNEITAFAPLLDEIELQDVLITADALHTQRGHAEYLHKRGGHYLWIAKANQPRLHTPLLRLPWQKIPVVRSPSCTSNVRAGTAAPSTDSSHSPPSGTGSGSHTPSWPSNYTDDADQSDHRSGPAKRSTR